MGRTIHWLSLALLAQVGWAQSSERIRVNQVGYAVGQPKIAISRNAGDSAMLVDSATGKQVWKGKLASAVRWSAAGDTGRMVDFSSFEIPGSYRLVIGGETSHTVHVAADPFLDLARASVKAFWYNRASYALPETWAGRWARAEGHPDTAVLVHASAATAHRPTGTRLRLPGGWYDAGDYGKYVVNSGISTWTLLYLYEQAPAFFDTLSLGVPAHSGSTSDLLDEALWNLRWMLSMQDPEDGGVYHKLTTAQFSGFVMPDKDTAARYVVQKSTAATLDLAAVAACAVRVLGGIPQFAPLVDSCRAASLSAWAWARRNPKNFYDQDTMNAHFDPPVGTGAYPDGDVSDEFKWAATELFLATGLDSFAVAESLSKVPPSFPWLGWADVGTIGWVELLSHKGQLAGSLAGISKDLDAALLATTSSIRDYRDRYGYHIPEGGFWWGGNAVFANNGLLLWKSWQASGDTSYRNASLEALDYLLGRNATGYCFVTGFGEKSPMHIHHRPSAADTVVAPVPGFLVGGPNSGQEDKCKDYPSTLGPKSYVDDQNCYAVNEVAINWNAPLAFLAGSWAATLEAGQASSGISTSAGRSAVVRLEFAVRTGAVTIRMPGHEIAKVELFGTDGRLFARVGGARDAVELAAGKGLWIVRAQAADGALAVGKVIVPR